jgi:hypothetical protein
LLCFSNKTNPSLFPACTKLPIKNGIFNLNRIINWKVYNILGIKIAEGKGAEINLSSFSKGLYILKAEKEIAKSLLFY